MDGYGCALYCLNFKFDYESIISFLSLDVILAGTVDDARITTIY